MTKTGYTGISYPFRINSKGGVAMSTTSNSDPTHIKEGIEQIFKTHFLERVMEGDNVYTSVSMLLFEPDNVALQNVLRARIIDDFNRLDDRININGEDIEFVSGSDENSGVLYIRVRYTIIKYNTSYTSEIRIGDIDEQTGD